MSAPIRQNAVGVSVEGSWSDPAVDLVPITPSDSVNLPQAARAIRCRPTGATGTLRLVTMSGQTRDTAISAGELLPVSAVAVKATGTTATGLEALL